MEKKKVEVGGFSVLRHDFRRVLRVSVAKLFMFG